MVSIEDTFLSPLQIVHGTSDALAAPGLRTWMEIMVVFTSLWPSSYCTVRMWVGSLPFWTGLETVDLPILRHCAASMTVSHLVSINLSFTHLYSYVA
jgi:hypothetical protein